MSYVGGYTSYLVFPRSLDEEKRSKERNKPECGTQEESTRREDDSKDDEWKQWPSDSEVPEEFRIEPEAKHEGDNKHTYECWGKTTL